MKKLFCFVLVNKNCEIGGYFDPPVQLNKLMWLNIRFIFEN